MFGQTSLRRRKKRAKNSQLQLGPGREDYWPKLFVSIFVEPPSLTVHKTIYTQN